MYNNNYLNSDLQKTFLPVTPVWQNIRTSSQLSLHHNKLPLAVSWLDITNACGTPSSSSHYHTPPEFCRLMQSCYTGLSATISIEEWSTGVYQGDPLSVVVFLTVINNHLTLTLGVTLDLLSPTLPSSLTICSKLTILVTPKLAASTC